MTAVEILRPVSLNPILGNVSVQDFLPDGRTRAQRCTARSARLYQMIGSASGTREGVFRIWPWPPGLSQVAPQAKARVYAVMPSAIFSAMVQELADSARRKTERARR